MTFELPSLPYEYAALEPQIDATTMEIHHSKHHAGYTNNLNALCEEHSAHASIEELLTTISTLPQGVRNNAGGFYNHNLFWTNLAPGGVACSAGFKARLTEAFESFEGFKEQFAKAAATRFGSGWAWLIYNQEGKLEIVSTPNQDNPLMDVADVKGVPLLALDVWEHAYYLHYQNKRPEYIENFWEVVNWEEVESRYNKATA